MLRTGAVRAAISATSSNLILFILFTISLIIFTVTEILPGDAAAMILGQQATPETLAALRTRLGLDQPAYLRYLHWIGGVLHGDWGSRW